MSQQLFNKLLDYYGINESEYQDLIKPVDESSFAYGHHFKDIEKAHALLDGVIANNGKIVIYGDYDADGVMGTSILVKMLLYKNVHPSYYLPNRYVDGYGLTLEKAKEYVENKYDLVICVDNGIAAIEPIKYLKEHDVKVLVLDHHELQGELPPADVILHPIYSNFGSVASSGAFVAFMFSIEFLGFFDKYLSILASISLISDMMPLKEYNRNLLRLVFSNYHDGEFFTIDALKEMEPFNEVTIGMKIAPKINAIGRMIDGNEINNLVEYFTSSKKDELLHYIEWINSTNEDRKNLSKEVAQQLENFSSDEKGIVYISNVKEGLLGLIANSLVNKYRVPTLVMALEKSGESYKGSCRAPEGFNVVKSFETLKDYFEAFGGHPGAGGCTVKKEKIDAFKNAFLNYCETHPLEKIEKPYIDLSITDINLDNLRLIETFSPFGEAFPRPLLKISNVHVPSLFFSRNGEHLISKIGQNAKLTGFGISRSSLEGYRYIDIYGSLRESIFNGYITTEFVINDYQKHN